MVNFYCILSKFFNGKHWALSNILFDRTHSKKISASNEHFISNSIQNVFEVFFKFFFLFSYSYIVIFSNFKWFWLCACTSIGPRQVNDKHTKRNSVHVNDKKAFRLHILLKCLVKFHIIHEPPLIVCLFFFCVCGSMRIQEILYNNFIFV